ncbi:uncharacterized protein [Nicotiana sylvestris]|uniref:uncharacterized protein n=1 Tax=Nicotiana sylvestris TaxID=4096 RepID=UPI00388C6553
MGDTLTGTPVNPGVIGAGAIGTSRSSVGTQACNEVGVDLPHTSGAQLISFQLTGTAKYTLWNRSMRIALRGRNKLGLVEGTWKKEKFHENLWEQWERCNAIVLSWLMNAVTPQLFGGVVYGSDAHAVWEDLREKFNKVDGSRSFNIYMEIATLYQGTSSVSEYYTKLKDLWDEFEALIPAPCDCEKSRDYVNHMKRQKLYQFLMRLNESYFQARSQILMMNPLPSVNKAYSMIMSDESQKSIAAIAVNLSLQSNAMPENYESTVLLTTRSGGFQPSFQPNNFQSNNFQQTGNYQKPRRNNNEFCDYCRKKGHSKENCWKLIGYPQGSKFKKKGGASAYNAVENEPNQNNFMQPQVSPQMQSQLMQTQPQTMMQRQPPNTSINFQ